MKSKINQLITYAIDKQIIDERDAIYFLNQICYLLSQEVNFEFEKTTCNQHIDDILSELSDSYKQFPTTIERELFKSKLIGTLIERPSAIEAKFNTLYGERPSLATDYFYELAKRVNYIKERQIANNIEYAVTTTYGDIDITINLSKPEKSPAEIEALKNAKSSNWPKCFLCKEHEGLYGSMTSPDRSNHRIVALELNAEKWYLQYSPYSYFNEHAIVFSEHHCDMQINSDTFKRLVEFVDKFPHYMIGSNADLPIVGGSMLTHDHYQAGNYEFPLFKAKSNVVNQIGDVELHAVNWPMHTVKLVTSNQQQLLEVANSVFKNWQAYCDVSSHIIAQTNKAHNTITPIVRKHSDNYEMYLILRNNNTDEDHPHGIYHVDSIRHHIKKENIGLIEAMGLAVLPGRLKTEFTQIVKHYQNDEQLPAHLQLHMPLYQALDAKKPKDEYQFLLTQAGLIFAQGLADCGVFKYDEQKYHQFIKDINDRAIYDTI